MCTSNACQRERECAVNMVKGPTGPGAHSFISKRIDNFVWKLGILLRTNADHHQSTVNGNAIEDYL